MFDFEFFGTDGFFDLFDRATGVVVLVGFRAAGRRTGGGGGGAAVVTFVTVAVAVGVIVFVVGTRLDMNDGIVGSETSPAGGGGSGRSGSGFWSRGSGGSRTEVDWRSWSGCGISR